MTERKDIDPSAERFEVAVRSSWRSGFESGRATVCNEIEALLGNRVDVRLAAWLEAERCDRPAWALSSVPPAAPTLRLVVGGADPEG